MKFGDRVFYDYLHHLNRKASTWVKVSKPAIFVKQEDDNVWVVCEGNKNTTKTTLKHISERSKMTGTREEFNNQYVGETKEEA